MRKSKTITVILISIFLVGFSVLFYPSFSNYYNSFHQSYAVSSYQESLSQLKPTDYTELLADADSYNKAIAVQGRQLFAAGEPQDDAYKALLSVNDDGMIGFISIEKINIQLPIYHGTSEAILAGAVGHLEGSSLPVGGTSTHCVLSAHRGLPSSRLFTDIDQLEVGDTFILSVLDQVLTYEVDNIAIIEPDEVDLLKLSANADYCTLLTCTPYGVNTQRLAVRGHRVENQEESVNIKLVADAVLIEPLLVALFVAIPILIIMALYVFVGGGKKSQKE